MSDVTARFFQELSARGYEPLLRNVTGTLRFEVSADGRSEQWWLRIDKGDLGVSTPDTQTSRAAPDCVIEAQTVVFDRIAIGDVNAVAAMLRGDVVVQGDPELLVACQRLFPAPAHRGAGASAEGGGGRVS